MEIIEMTADEIREAEATRKEQEEEYIKSLNDNLKSEFIKINERYIENNTRYTEFIQLKTGKFDQVNFKYGINDRLSLFSFLLVIKDIDTYEKWEQEFKLDPIKEKIRIEYDRLNSLSEQDQDQEIDALSYYDEVAKERFYNPDLINKHDDKIYQGIIELYQKALLSIDDEVEKAKAELKKEYYKQNKASNTLQAINNKDKRKAREQETTTKCIRKK